MGCVPSKFTQFHDDEKKPAPPDTRKLLTTLQPSQSESLDITSTYRQIVRDIKALQPHTGARYERKVEQIAGKISNHPKILYPFLDTSLRNELALKLGAKHSDENLIIPQDNNLLSLAIKTGNDNLITKVCITIWLICDQDRKPLLIHPSALTDAIKHPQITRQIMNSIISHCIYMHWRTTENGSTLQANLSNLLNIALSRSKEIDPTLLTELEDRWKHRDSFWTSKESQQRLLGLLNRHINPGFWYGGTPPTEDGASPPSPPLTTPGVTAGPGCGVSSGGGPDRTATPGYPGFWYGGDSPTEDGASPPSPPPSLRSN